MGIAFSRAFARRPVSSMAASSGVSVGPGQTQFSVMPVLASSRATDLLNAMTPPLQAA